VTDTRIGRHIVLHIAAADAKSADAQVREMCGRLLANPVTEDFEIAAVESA
jgi:phosphoribosylformylglycinamidine synthase PurS subunit